MERAVLEDRSMLGSFGVVSVFKTSKDDDAGFGTVRFDVLVWLDN